MTKGFSGQVGRSGGTATSEPFQRDPCLTELFPRFSTPARESGIV